MTQGTETPSDQASSVEKHSSQTHLVFSLPGAMDSRALRCGILKEGLLPKSLWDNATFFGHRGSLNVAALSPDGAALADYAADIGLWLAERTGHHVPIRVSEQPVKATLTERPTTRAWGPVVLVKPGKDWARASDPDWVRARLEHRLSSDLVAAAQRWGVEIGKPPSITGIGRTMPIKMQVATTDTPITLMCAVGVKVRWDVDLSGIWAFGPLCGAGFGRLAHDIEVLPSAMRRIISGKHVPRTLAEQLEALL